MGLDMFATAVRVPKCRKCLKVGESLFDVLGYKDEKAIGRLEKAGAINYELGYWRKFNNLHGWMERLYRQHGGTGDFNCDHVRLDLEDLDRLWEDAPTLPPAEGFFFGSVEEMTEEDVKEARDFVEKARDAIKSGQVVIYSGWW